MSFQGRKLRGARLFLATPAHAAERCGYHGYRDMLRQEPCSYCGGWARKTLSRTLDHIVAEAFGGTDNLLNMTPSCLGCNMRKGTDSALFFLVKRGGYGASSDTPRRYRSVARRLKTDQVKPKAPTICG